MKQIDMKTLETALIYVNRLAEGKNPVNNQQMDDDTVLNNPNVIRCMFFVKDVLQAVYENKGNIGGRVKNSSERADKVFPFKALEQFLYREDKGISKLIDQMYEPVANQKLKKISGKRINDWLTASGYITEIYSEEYKKDIKIPTEKGEQLGLRAERIEYRETGYSYILIMYNRHAQEFIVKNMEKILNGEVV